MRKQTKLVAVLSAAALLAMGASMVLCQDLVQVKMRNFSPF